MSLHGSDEAGYTNNNLQLDEENSSGPASERRKRVRACDMCRRRKVGCDGGRMPGHQCSNCQAYRYTCTYTHSSKKRFADPEYVQNLETRLAQTEDRLQKLSSRLELLDPQHAEMDRSQTVASSAQSPEIESEDPAQRASQASLRFSNMAAAFDRDDDDANSSDDELMVRQNIEQKIQHLSLGAHPPQFMGKSSGLNVLQTVLDVKDAYTSREPHSHKPVQMQLADTRSEFWSEIPWIKETSAPYSAHVFPAPDLMRDLHNLYFQNCNVYLPLLHRPTFEKQVREGLHLVDESFGATVLLTCALGAKFSDDPQTRLIDSNVHSSGWKWFKCVQETRKAFRSANPTVHDLQIFALVAEFYHSSPIASCTLVVVATGIRTSQDLGAHRRKVYATLPADEGELLKRAFWVLMSLDRIISSGLGRSCCIQDEDFDVDYPRECDDEYWYNSKGEPVFAQPPGKPSLVAFFNCLIRLNQIHGCALRTIYATNKSKSLLGFTGPDWEQHIVRELDSALNKWADTIPNHLKWDPQMQNMTYLNQSAHLYTSYYHLQMVIHRPYLPSPRKHNTSPFPSLAICTNAARSCVHVSYVQYNRSDASTWQNLITLFPSAVVLLLNIWTGKRAGANIHSEELMNVHQAMIMLKAMEKRWHLAGKFHDILCELATAGDLPLPPTWENDSAKSTSSSNISTPSSMSNDSAAQRTRYPQTPISSMSSFVQGTTSNSLPASFEFSGGSLPMHTDELGRYPLYPTFNPGQPTMSFTMPANAWTPMVTDPPVPSTPQASNTISNNGMNVDGAFPARTGMIGGPYQTPENFFGYTPPPDLPSPPSDQSRLPPPTEPHDSWGTLPNMLDSGTEALWATAPHCSMEWEDWGRYIISVNGMGSMADPNSAQPPF